MGHWFSNALIGAGTLAAPLLGMLAMPATPALGAAGGLIVQQLLRSGAVPASAPTAIDTAIDTGFDPRRDGMAFDNLGHTTSAGRSNGGDCAGMSTFAALWYSLHRRNGTPRLRDAFPGDTPVLRDLAHVAQTTQFTSYWTEEVGPSSRGTSTGARILSDMRRTGEPQPFVFQFRDAAGQVRAHEVLVTGYRDGHFLVYDPNHPDELVQLDFGAGGFGGFHYANGLPLPEGYGDITSVGTFDLAEAGGDERLSRILRAVRQGSHRDPNDVTVARSTLDGARELRVEGQIANYRPTDGRRLELTIDGAVVPARATISPDGRFVVTVDPRHIAIMQALRALGGTKDPELIEARIQAQGPLQAHLVTRDDDGSYAGGASLPPLEVRTSTEGFVARIGR